MSFLYTVCIVHFWGVNAKDDPVASWTTVFLSYTAECGQYIEQHKSSVYRPKRQLQSGCL